MNNKLLLFDIDGTLLSCRGIPKKVFLEIIQKRFPHFTNGEHLQFSGMTDIQIVTNLFKMNGYGGEIDPELIDKILAEFTTNLAKNMNVKNPPKILSGVFELLDRCMLLPNCYLGLVTGNTMTGAQIKLRAGGLYHYFAVGAFGNDHGDRNLLPPVAVERAEHYYDKTFEKENIWIIGDSIYDIRCAKVNDLKCLAVYSGITKRGELQTEQPDYIFKNLQNTNHILDVFGLKSLIL